LWFTVRLKYFGYGKIIKVKWDTYWRQYIYILKKNLKNLKNEPYTVRKYALLHLYPVPVIDHKGTGERSFLENCTALD
jgi:hypothetical protein